MIREGTGDRPWIMDQLNKIMQMYNSRIKVTVDGGIAIKLINNTGAASVKGTLVDASTTVNLAFVLGAKGAIDIIGIVYEDGIADGSDCWIVIQGVAYVYFIGSTTRGDYARMCITGDAGSAVGQAVSEALPTSPFATDKHFQEIGHVIETRTGAGLARVILHFN